MYLIVYISVLQLTCPQALTLQTLTVQQLWPSITEPYNLCLRRKIQTVSPCLSSWFWNLQPEEHSLTDSFREEDRHKKILEAYPCFKDIGHVSHYWLSIIQNMAPHKTMSCMPISSSYLMQPNVFICILDRWWRSFNAFWTKITSTTLMNWREDGTTSARRCSFLVCGKSCWNPQ